MAILILLAVAACVFAPDFPSWLDPYLLLLGYAGGRVTLSRLPLLVFLIAFLKGSATLDPTWYYLVLATAGTGMMVILRRSFYTVRVINQVWLTFVLGLVLEGGAVVHLMVGYPHSDRLALLEGVLKTAGLTALVAPIVYGILERFLLRPARFRRGLLPMTGA